MAKISAPLTKKELANVKAAIKELGLNLSIVDNTDSGGHNPDKGTWMTISGEKTEIETLVDELPSWDIEFIDKQNIQEEKMTFKSFLQELDLKGAAKKSGLAKLHAQQQEKKKNEFEARYNTGMPVKVKVKVYTKKAAWKDEAREEYREFTIDNLINIRHKLDGITLIDMSSVEDDKAKHDGKITWAIKKDGRQLPGGLPEYLHGLPARTKKKPGFDAYDLRREAWTDSPMPTYEAAGKFGAVYEAKKPDYEFGSFEGWLTAKKFDEDDIDDLIDTAYNHDTYTAEIVGMPDNQKLKKITDKAVLQQKLEKEIAHHAKFSIAGRADTPELKAAKAKMLAQVPIYAKAHATHIVKNWDFWKDII